MTDPFIGDTAVFCSSLWEPEQWMFCDGRELEIERFTALYATIGDQYGGDAKRTFALPKIPDPVPGASYVMAVEGWFRARDDRSVWAPDVVAFAREWLGAPPPGTMVPTGQIINIRDNRELFAVIGYAFGGNGQTTFALPNLGNRFVLCTEGKFPRRR